MSDDQNRIDRYALKVGRVGSPGDRAVLLALAIRANKYCGCAISGKWLEDFMSQHDGTIRRHVHTIADAGIWEVRHQLGGPLVVRFPEALLIHNPAHQCAGCDMWGRAMVQQTPRNGAGNPAQQCAGKPYENQYENPPEPEHGFALPLDEIRKIWRSARDETRERRQA